MSESFDRSQVLGFFIDESQEQIGLLNNLILSLEKNPGSMDLINEIFRTAHTLKGASGMMGFKKVSDLAHAMEDLLGVMRDRKVGVTPRVMDVLFRALDGIGAFLSGISETGIEPDGETINDFADLPGLLRDIADRMEKKGQDFKDQTDEVEQPVEKQEQASPEAPGSGDKSKAPVPEKPEVIDVDPEEEIFKTIDWSLKELSSDPTSRFGLSDIQRSAGKIAELFTSDFPEAADLAGDLVRVTGYVLDDNLTPDPVLLAAFRFAVETLKDLNNKGKDDYDEAIGAAVKRSLTNALEALRTRPAETITPGKQQVTSKSDEPPVDKNLPLKFFKEEADIHIEKITTALHLLAETHKDAQARDILKKNLGYLKGSAMAMGFETVGEIAEKMEIVTTSASRTTGVTAAVIGALRECLKEIMTALQGKDISNSSLRVLSYLWRTAEADFGGIKVKDVPFVSEAGSAQEAGISLKSKKPLRPPKSVVEKDHQQSDEPMLIHNIEEIAPDKRTLVKKKESKKLKAVQMKQQTPPVQKSGPGKSTAGAASGVQTVRVAIGKLDSLMNLVGELLFNKLRMDQKVVNINGLQEWFSELQTRLLKIQNVFEAFNGDDEESAEIMKELMAGNVESLKVFLQEVRNIGEQFAHLDGEFSDLVLELSEGMGRLSTVTSDLQEGIMKTRMLPISTVFDKFPRLVRDLSRNSSKEVILDIAGGDTELDKTVLEKVSDPLIHLIRNTVDHGIETQEEREVLNKPRAGHVWLKAEQCGDIVVIEIADDGRGIDHERIAAVAIEKGILTPDEAHRRQPWELRNLIFSPGFSTKETVTEVSGRGVGCDVVKRNIEGLKGIIELESEVNMGSTFRIKLPLTLAIIQGLVIRCWDERYVIPLSSVVESLKMSPDMVIAIGGKEAVRVRDEVLPFIRLDKVLEVPGGISEEEENFLVIVASAEKRLGFSVHELIGKQEIVIKTLGSLLKHVNNIAGSTIMGDGRVLLIMDVAALVQQGFAWIRDVTALDNERPVFEEKGKIILVVDDSPTIRSIERHLLESEGYQVVTAENGEKGIEAARRVAPALVISDVEMPVMNGYEMVKAIRADETLKKLPIVMVTTRSSEEDRIKGLRAGANEYLGKPFEQQALLKTIKRFLG